MPDPKPNRSRRSFQFSLGALLLFMAAFSVLSAAWAGMLRDDATVSPGVFVAMAAALPLAGVVLLGATTSLIRWWRRRR